MGAHLGHHGNQQSVLYMTLHLFGIFLRNGAVPTLIAGDQADGLTHHLVPECRVPRTNEVTLHLSQKLVKHLRLGMLQPKKYTLLTTQHILNTTKHTLDTM